jgi:hypothetical protein
MLRRLMILLGTAVCMLHTELHAQVLVDAGGARNVFFSASAPSSNMFFGLKGTDFKLDTAAKSAELLYFHPNGNSHWLWGLDLKVAAVNGIENLNSWPQTTVSGIGNYSWQSSGALWSLTARDTPLFAQDPLYDTNRPAGAQFYKKDVIGNELAGTLSVAPVGSIAWISFALSAGYNATNNYAKLQQVTVGNSETPGSSQAVIGSGQTARFGTFHYYNAFPLTLLTPLNPDAVAWMKPFDDGFSDFVNRIYKLLGTGKKEDAATNVNDVIVSPYGEFVPGDLGRPTDAVGINFVVRRLTLNDNPAKENLTFPVSIFVERENAFLGKPSMTVGAGLIFKWP